MWVPRDGEKKGGNGPVAVAIDKDKGSQYALKWAIDHLLQRGQTVFLIHVSVNQSALSSPLPSPRKESDLSTARDLFLPFRCFCIRKDIQCQDVLLEGTDVARAIAEYVSNNAIENLVVGSPAKSGFLRRFKIADTASSLTKAAPDFCNVFVISKGKISNMKSASRPAPPASPLALPNQSLSQSITRPSPPEPRLLQTNDSSIGGGSGSGSGSGRPSTEETPYSIVDNIETIRSPFVRGRASNGRLYGELTPPDSDISFVSSGRPSFDFPAFTDSDSGTRLSTASDYECSFEVPPFPWKSMDTYTLELSPPPESERSNSCASPIADDVEAEMRRLRLELKQTIEMYSNACKEALTATQRAKELQKWKQEEQRKVEEARLAEEAALALAEKEKARSKAAMETAEAAQRIAGLEAQKRISAEMKAIREAEEKRKVLNALANADLRYRKYTIEDIEIATDYFSASRKIGEGGYGPVYKCYLDHTAVAIKVLRPDAAQGRSQFLREVEVLSCIRHPNMVLLLGACPEYGCLVYEFMANGSLEDRLFCRGNTLPLSWKLRFKIAAEIGTGLLFLHHTKPEPLVHRDLKPANILLDSNFVSKISDVGLARLVPPSVADTVTQYRMTSTAGTFCYIDPEYQQTGMLGVKSDIYSLGIILLQIITGRPPMGLTHYVDEAIEDGTFSLLLDPTVPDWPLEETLCLAKMALKCAELRRKDRPDLGKVVLPELNRLRAIAEGQMNTAWMGDSSSSSPQQSQV